MCEGVPIEVFDVYHESDPERPVVTNVQATSPGAAIAIARRTWRRRRSYEQGPGGRLLSRHGFYALKVGTAPVTISKPPPPGGAA